MPGQGQGKKQWQGEQKFESMAAIGQRFLQDLNRLGGSGVITPPAAWTVKVAVRLLGRRHQSPRIAFACFAIRIKTKVEAAPAQKRARLAAPNFATLTGDVTYEQVLELFTDKGLSVGQQVECRKDSKLVYVIEAGRHANEQK